MRITFTFITILVLLTPSKGQENYRDFESIQKVFLGEWNGTMDSTALNTFTNIVNTSSTCGKYIRRDTALYDNLKLFPLNMLVNVSPYTDTAASAPKITMKVRTNAPSGTLVRVQLGSRTSITYPEGVHSEYTATTTVSNAWELLTFKYSMSPVGGFTTSTAINKIVIFFHPNSHTSDTIYFDDPSGPEILIAGIHENAGVEPFKLYQNNPNPAAECTNIKLQLNSSGNVSIELFDVLGRNTTTLTDQIMDKGMHIIPLETSKIPTGIYFYTLKMQGYTQTKRMIISR